MKSILVLLVGLIPLFSFLSSEASDVNRTAKGSAILQSSRIPDDESTIIAFFSYPPLAHIAPSGRLSGTVIETVREICSEAGLNCEFKILPVARVYRSVSDHTASAIITGRHPSFGDCCTTSDWQFPWSAGIYSRLPPEHMTISESELKGHRMIVIRGWESPYRYFKDLAALSESGAIKLAMAKDNHSAVRMLQHGRAEYLWGGKHFSWYFEKKGLGDVFHYTPLIQAPLAIWVDKRRPDIRQALDEGYQSLKARGALSSDGSQLKADLMKARYEEPARY
ncbi:substrate-binding periplasmic protein [Oceanospirillum sp.]|uniref:substrate-binding periplasmic protein n=1 Tax=Oceanospirillum sp. TaxID=2021254 RepID=UPI003A931DCF